MSRWPTQLERTGGRSGRGRFPTRWAIRVARRLGLLAALLPGCALWARAASANGGGEGLPSDVQAGWEAAAAEAPDLPAPPQGYVSERIGEVRWVFPRSNEEEARELQDAFDDAWSRILDDLGVEVEREMVIRIGTGPEAMRALAPEGHPPPQYASGVAYPAWGVILLTLTAPETWQRPAMEKVLAHELSHIALRRAVRGRPLPQWFVEGVAIHQADEYSIERIRTLWQAAVQDGLIPLSELSARFPARPGEVGVAYAQSADVVRFLREDDLGARRFRQLIEGLREGSSFDEALMDAYFLSPKQLEREWRADVDERYQALPLVLGGGGVWAVAGLFVVVAWMRRRRKHKRKIAEWAEQEEAVDRAERAVDERAPRTREPRSPQNLASDDAPVEDDDDDEDEDERIVVYVSGEPPGGREEEVPTVEYEGRSHTLH